MEDFEKQIQSIRNENEFILDRFKNNLIDKKLSKSTVDKHVGNIDFYVNTYLLNYEPMPANKGASQVGFFLGNWFIRKAMWASVASIKENITSMKKFYQFMYEAGEIEKDVLVELKDEIKDCKNEWLENIKMYDNPNIGLDDIW